MSEFSYINWNHGKNPSDIIGEPERWKNIPGKGMYMEGYIYPDSEKGQQAVELMKVLRNSKKGNQLGWSVEGQVLERDLLNEKKVKKTSNELLYNFVSLTYCQQRFQRKA